MAADENYIYSEVEVGSFEGPFVLERRKWVHSLEKRLRRLRGVFFRPRGRIRERIVEGPLVLAAMGQMRPGRVADIGGASSTLGLELAYLGHEVHVLDLRACPLRHPKLQVQQIDLFDNKLADDTFDAISCISVVEHVGIDRYGGARRPDGDMAFMRELGRLCRPGGMILLSGPYGRGHNPETEGKPFGYRIYNRQRLERLLEGFGREGLRFFVMEAGCWVEVDSRRADEVATHRPIDGIFFAQLRKENQR